MTAGFELRGLTLHLCAMISEWSGWQKFCGCARFGGSKEQLPHVGTVIETANSLTYYVRELAVSITST